MKYRKKPIIIEAYQTDVELDIETLEGVMHASVGDYIITGINGEKYPCKPDIFEKTYELVKESNYETSKELKAFYELKESIEYKGGDFYCANEQRLNIIETALKALEIIKEKEVAIQYLKESETEEIYNQWAWFVNKESLTKEEFELLKEVLL